MPPRNPELPEGTDHIVNGAMETGGGGTGANTGGGVGTGFVGRTAGNDTGGTSMSDGRGNNGGNTGADIKAQLREGVSSIQSQAGEKVRAYAETGKSKATGALDEFSQVVSDAATTIDERLGSEYGEYARRAADAVSGFADTLRNKQVDELFEDGRELVRKSPGVAIGVAAVVGFTLVRLLKAGVDSNRNEREIEFEPDMDNSRGAGSTGAGGTGTGV